MGEVKSSWASEIEIEEDDAPSETIDGNTKVVTDFFVNEDEKKVKWIRTYKIEKKIVSKAIARRKGLAKFGDCLKDRPGPDPATTQLHEEVTMQYISSKEENEKDSNDTELDKLKKMNKGMIKCRICKEDHWTTNCPYKDTLGPLRESLSAGKEDEDPEKSESPTPAPNAGSSAPSSRAYVPPSRREGARDRIIGDSMSDRRRNEDNAAIRVSNLSENTQESDVQELFKPFGAIARIFLAKDKQTGQCKGFAFIHYYKKEEAAKAIATLNGYGYDYLILSVEWAKPTGT
ncbi:eukaryotic translation initiation factor 3 subunit G [Lepeophtheirus salmonis]|uniref:Eukaryotic translation initiation factor 3 subunit G n=1 Tax=Lepeophtheirus salmonis TaxID=72036 RepID=D3PGX5_LEPSM|nr:eukaryotic translation initiation factor 3 subunit G-like [Lepeophtheirus salmonis]ADD24521.1 Eukaryotic translation initiation factor 3 subunit G [Lepeophtheirus salmonis]